MYTRSEFFRTVYSISDCIRVAEEGELPVSSLIDKVPF